MADVEPVLPWIHPGWVGVEIGVAEGNSAKALLNKGVRLLYVVDPWKNYPDLFDQSVPGSWEKFYQNVFLRHPSRLAVLRMTSAEAVSFIPEVDFAWIDGNHRYEWVKSDLELYWPKVRTGGVLCGHDYTNCPPTCEVMRAVQEFVLAHRLKLETPLPCWVVQK